MPTPAPIADSGQHTVIESRQNSRVKQLRAAFAGNLKLSGGMIAIEGEHLLLEALRSGLPLDAVFVQEGREALPGGVALPAAQKIIRLSEDVFRSAVETEAPQGIAALLRQPEFAREALLGLAGALPGWPGDQSTAVATPLILVAAGLQDPGNLGTLVRSAEAFGATGVLTLAGTVSIWNQKALRASAGSAFRVPVVADRDGATLNWLRSAGVRLLAAVASHSSPSSLIADVDLCLPSALLIGNEGAGLSSELMALADERITIPCPGPVESLNAAIAGSLLLYEASRQRASKDKA